MLANWETFKATVGEENIADPSAASIWVNKRLNGLCYICDTDGRYGRCCSLPSPSSPSYSSFRTVGLIMTPAVSCQHHGGRSRRQALHHAGEVLERLRPRQPHHPTDIHVSRPPCVGWPLALAASCQGLHGALVAADPVVVLVSCVGDVVVQFVGRVLNQRDVHALLHHHRHHHAHRHVRHHTSIVDATRPPACLPC